MWSPFFVALLGNPGAGAAAGVRPLRWGWGRTRPSAAPRPQRALLDPCFENPPRAAFSGKIRPPPPPSPQGPSPPSPSPPRNRRAFAAFSSLAILPAFLPILIPDRGAGGSPRAGLPCQTPPFPHPVPWKSGLLLPRLGRDPAAGPREIRAGQPRPSRPGPARRPHPEAAFPPILPSAAQPGAPRLIDRPARWCMDVSHCIVAGLGRSRPTSAVVEPLSLIAVDPHRGDRPNPLWTRVQGCVDMDGCTDSDSSPPLPLFFFNRCGI